jgi:hypothetical protein
MQLGCQSEKKKRKKAVVNIDPPTIEIYILPHHRHPVSRWDDLGPWIAGYSRKKR